MKLTVLLAAVLLLRPGLVAAQDAVKVDPKHYTTEFENDQVRVVRVTYAPGEKSPMHSHPNLLSRGFVSFARSQSPIATQSSVVGTWLLESIVDTLPDGSLYYWMGQRPVGVIMYDAAGHVAVQFMRDPRPTLSRGPEQATLMELRSAYDGYYAYFGRYDLTGDSVTHVVEASHRPAEVGIRYRRAVRILGDRLFISLRTEVGGVPHRRVLTWRRAG